MIDGRIRRTSTGRYVDRLLEHLQTLDHENIYTVLLQPDDPWRPTASNFSVAACPFAQFSLNPADQIRFPRLLKKLKPDLVHFPMNQQPIFYRGRVVTTTMDLTMLRFTRPGRTPLPLFWLKMAAYRYLFWLSNKKSAAIITITNFVKHDLEVSYPFTKGKITVTYCASEPPLEAGAVKPKTARRPFIFYVGTAFPHKNLKKLVDAFKIVKQTNPDLQLILAGKREYYYEQLEGYAAKVGASGVNITGFVTDEELKWLYQNAEAYVFPSLSEGFGLPPLEAMVHGLPVISSNASCLPEINGPAAHYFDPANPQDIAAKINDVLSSDVLRKDLIKKGYAQVKKYSWERTAEQTLAVYKSVLDASSSPKV